MRVAPATARTDEHAAGRAARAHKYARNAADGIRTVSCVTASGSLSPGHTSVSRGNPDRNPSSAAYTFCEDRIVSDVAPKSIEPSASAASVVYSPDDAAGARAQSRA